MGSVIVGFNEFSKIDRMAECYTRRSTQELIDEFHDDCIHVKKFARVNGTGTRLARDDQGNLIGLLGLTGIEKDGTFVTDLGEILKCYLETGDDQVFANRLWGNFVLFIYLKRKCELKVVRDFASSMDFYISQFENGYYLSNSSLALAECLPVSANLPGIANVLTYLSLLDDMSLFVEIEKLQAASIYTIKASGDLECRKYADLPTTVSDGPMDAKVVAGIIEKSLLLTSKFSKTMGLDLSGGFDTRLMLAGAFHAGLNFVACVHGEDNMEVRFVRDRIAKRLSIPLRILSLGKGEIERFAEKALLCHYLFDGSYPIFGATIEGCRSLERMKYCDSKINGTPGEHLRDKVYRYLYGFSGQDSIMPHLRHKFVNMYCNTSEDYFVSRVLSGGFREYVQGPYREHIQRLVDRDLDRFTTDDFGYIYCCLILFHEDRGWTCEILGSHNRIILTSAPAMTKQFLAYVLPKGSKWRKDAFMHIETIRFLSDKCTEIPMINGWPCQVKTWRNAWRFWIGDKKRLPQRLLRVAKRLVLGKNLDFGTTHRYDFRILFNSLCSNEYFRYVLNDITSIVPGVFDRENMGKMLERAALGELSMLHYQFLAKVITLAVTFDIASRGTVMPDRNPVFEIGTHERIAHT